MKNKNENMHIVELEFEGGSLEVVFFYEYKGDSVGLLVC